MPLGALLTPLVAIVEVGHDPVSRARPPAIESLIQSLERCPDFHGNLSYGWAAARWHGHSETQLRLGIDVPTVRRVGCERSQSRIEAKAGRAVGTKDRILVAHADVDVRMILWRRHADAAKFPCPDPDLRGRIVVPELRKAA